MSISSVITGGFGTPGSAFLVITDGYSQAAEGDRVLSATVSAATLYSCAVSARGAYVCTPADRALYVCTLSEAIVS